jgi:phosphoglycerate dehydrogenase-like enzyme
MDERIVIANQLGPIAGAVLRSHRLAPHVIDLPPDRAWEIPAEADVLFVVFARAVHGEASKIPRPEGWPGRTRWAQLASVGTSGYPDWIFELPTVTTMHGVNSPAIAEYVLAVMLAHEKRIPSLWVRALGDWPEPGNFRASMLGTLSGKTLGIVGAGGIARHVAPLAAAFGMTVVAARRDPTLASGHPALSIAPLDTVVANADHLLLAAPLTEQTRGLVDSALLARVKRGVHLINVSRGGLIDDSSLLAALDNGSVSAATIDVTEPEPLPAGHPLYVHPNVRISPHISWNVPGVAEALFARFLANLECFAEDRPLRDVVDEAR